MRTEIDAGEVARDNMLSWMCPLNWSPPLSRPLLLWRQGALTDGQLLRHVDGC